MCIGLAVGLVSCGEGCGCGGTEEGPPDNTNRIKPPPPPDPIEEKRTALDGTKWDIDVVRMADKGRKREPDKLIFVNNKVYVEKFKAQGYRASNYSLRMEPDGTAVWETMQSREDGDGVLFLKGEWREKKDGKDEKMGGVIIRHPKKGKNEDFAFISTAPPSRP